MMCRLMAVALSAAVVVGPSAAFAQEPQEKFIDKVRHVADDWQLVARLNGDIDGWYPRLGGMTTGSGFAFGPGYRMHVWDDRVLVDLSAAITMKGYKAVDTKAEWLQSRHRRVELWTNFRYQDFPQEDFYGLGFASNIAARTNYALTSRDVSAITIFHAARWLRLGALGGYYSLTVGPGTDRNFPSTETVFSDTQAPGLGRRPNFLHGTLYAEVDYRDERDRPRSGGYYRAAISKWDDRNIHAFDFSRLDMQAVQYLPLGSKRQVVVLRGSVSSDNNEPGDRVPFYFRPYVGGADTIRSFKEFRFTDENSLYLNAEYRHTVVPYVDVAVFWDSGKVTRDWHDVNLRGLKRAVGAGVRVGSRSHVYARLDIAGGGGEGRQIFFKLGPSF